MWLCMAIVSPSCRRCRAVAMLCTLAVGSDSRLPHEPGGRVCVRRSSEGVWSPRVVLSGHTGRDHCARSRCRRGMRDGKGSGASSAATCATAACLIRAPVFVPEHLSWCGCPYGAPRAVHCGPCRVPVRATADQVRASKCSYTLYMHMGPMRTGPNPRPERYVASRGHGDLLNASIEDSEIVVSVSSRGRCRSATRSILLRT